MPEPVGRVKACTECRQQKVRCDAFEDYSKPCSRCRAAKLPCIISRDFRRRKRQTKAQLQYELDRLRGNVPAALDDAELDSKAHLADEHDSKAPIEPSTSLARNTSSAILSDGQSSSNRRPSNPTAFSHSRSPTQITHHGTPSSVRSLPAYANDETKPRALDAVELSGSKINDCYHEFLTHYAPHLDGLFEQRVSPNDRYEQCPTLFWAMVCVGARRYIKDLDIFGQLEEPLIDLMFKSFKRPPQPLLVILAALIMCNWPMSIDLSYKDTSQALAGAAMNFAVQQGLHMYTHEHDFTVKTMAKVPHPFPEPTVMNSAMAKAIKMRDAALVFRTKIWSYSTVVFQSTSLCDGFPPTQVVPCFRKPEKYGEISSLLPDTIAYRLKLHKIQTTATNLICDACDFEGKGTQSPLNAMIATFDEQIRSIPIPHKDNIYHLMRSIARLLVNGLYFCAQTEPSHINMGLLYRVIREVIEFEIQMDAEQTDFTCYMPQWYFRLTYYGLHCLVRIYKSPLGEKLNRAEAEATFWAGMDILKKRCKYRNIDLAHPTIIMLSQLWSSDKVFVRGNQPQNGIRVDLRHRLALSPLFDNFWWWRREFGWSGDADNQSASKTRQLDQNDISSMTAGGTAEANLPLTAPLAVPCSNEPTDNMVLDNYLPGYMDWDYSSLQSDFYDLNNWLGTIDVNGPLEFQPWELSLGQR